MNGLKLVFGSSVVAASLLLAIAASATVDLWRISLRSNFDHMNSISQLSRVNQEPPLEYESDFCEGPPPELFIDACF